MSSTGSRKNRTINLHFIQFTVAERYASLGSALTIDLPKAIATSGTKFQMEIKYATTEKCTAVQFLQPE